MSNEIPGRPVGAAPVPAHRHRPRTPSRPSQTDHRIRWVVIAIIAVVIVGGILLYLQDAATRRNNHEEEQRTIARSEQRDQRLRDEVQAAEKRLDQLRKSAAGSRMGFNLLRRFGTSTRESPQYQGLLDGVRPCVLLATENAITTGDLGVKSYYGAVESIGEKPYTMEDGTTKWFDTYRAISVSAADIKTAEADLERAREQANKDINAGGAPDSHDIEAARQRAREDRQRALLRQFDAQSGTPAGSP